eukprot:TRINITY_DN16816_c0_g1_i1.p2 TRINITY_DN16816_c0_g1~~TRINITY_DN16816_c0_g1_i1.p2  ORF type:complete len:215 (+),score=68.89 TRINITY_DN16816_c0_g1_i1:71-715(+)
MAAPDSDDDPVGPPGYECDSLGRMVVPGRGIAAGVEVGISGVRTDAKLNGTWGTVVGRQGTAYFVHVAGAYGGQEVLIERNNLTVLEGGECAPEREVAAPEIAEGAVQAVRVRGLQPPLAQLNGLYRRAGISGTKFEQRLTDGCGEGALWRDKKDGRWKMSADGSTTRGWQPSHPELLGQWAEDPTAHDGSLVRGMPYPYITLASAAEHCHATI